MTYQTAGIKSFSGNQYGDTIYRFASDCAVGTLAERLHQASHTAVGNTLIYFHEEITWAKA